MKTSAKALKTTKYS